MISVVLATNTHWIQLGLERLGKAWQPSLWGWGWGTTGGSTQAHFASCPFLFQCSCVRNFFLSLLLLEDTVWGWHGGKDTGCSLTSGTAPISLLRGHSLWFLKDQMELGINPRTLACNVYCNPTSQARKLRCGESRYAPNHS